MLVEPNQAGARMSADICLVPSSEHKLDLKNCGRVFDWPGEYETKDVPITAFQAWTKAKSKEDEDNKAPETLIFCFEVGGVKFCHLGDLGHTLTSDMVNEIGDVDILMIKFGEGYNLDLKKGMEIIEAIEPRVVLTLSEKTAVALGKEVGTDNIEHMEKLVLKSSSELPEDKMRYINLAQA